MKKVFSVLFLSIFTLLGFAFTTNIQAEDPEIVDLYPYDQIACLLAEDSCVGTKVGSSHWTFTYYGHRYHFVKDVIRYGHEMIDDNSDGWIDDNELAGLSWNAFATAFVNNTASQIDVLTTNARTDITDVVHRMYAYFDETGVLAMFEDHISEYYIYNDGDVTTPDWRLATATEIAAYDAEVDAETIVEGDPSSDGLTRLTHIRIALSDTDTDGYVLEPLGYLKWTNADVDVTTETDKTKWSTIVDDDPNNVYIPAGWTVITFGTNDRGTLNKKTTAYIQTLPNALVDDTVDPFFMTYDDQPAVFSNVLSLDDDPTTAGVNIVVDYNGTFTLPTNISATWVNMFDDTTDAIINSTEHLDYKFEIFQEDTLLETINYTWDDTAKAYTASGEQTVIDTSEFGSAYKGVYTVVTPEGDTTEAELDIVIGVMPPKFAGVADRYVNEDAFVDVLEGITADDGYGTDKTDDIEVTLPDEFNPYYPQPGAYEIGLEFTHHVHFDGLESKLTYSYNSVDYDLDWDPETKLNADIDVNPGCTSGFCAWNDVTNFRDSASSWGSVWVVIGADGKIDEIYDRYTWNYITETGTVVGDATHFANWQATLTLDEGEFVLGAHGSASCAAQWRYMAYDDPMVLVVGTPDFDYDIVTNDSFILTVDDLTAPMLLVVDDNFTVDATDYDSVNDAILANIVAFDEYDSVDDLAIYVSDNGGLLLNTPGEYTVEVTVEDMAGNTTAVTFDVNVVAAPVILTAAQVQAMINAIDLLTEAEVQEMLDDQVLTQEEIQALIDASVMTEEQVQALIDAIDLLTETEVQAMIDDSITEAVPESGCGGSTTTAAIPGIEIFGLFALLGVVLFMFRKHS